MNKKGFTLLEINVVVLIVGLLAGLATLAILKGKKKSNIDAARAQLEMISAAVLQLAWDTGRWPNKALRTNPGSDEIWDLTTSKAGLLATDGSYPGWKGPYLDEMPLDPWGKPYFFDPDYQTNGVNRIAVGSFGPNKIGQNLYDKDDITVLLDD